VTLIIIASASATPTAAASAKALSAATTATALGTVGLGLRLINLQSPSAQFRAVQRRYSLIGLGGICHFHESEPAGPSRFAIGHNADFFHRTMSLEYGSQFGLGCAVGQITYIKVLHCISSLKILEVLNSAAFIFQRRTAAQKAAT
jgi:hypothetical protein